MKVRTLIELLSQENPEAIIKLHDKMGEELVFVMSEVNHDDTVWLETESDVSAKNEEEWDEACQHDQQYKKEMSYKEAGDFIQGKLDCMKKCGEFNKEDNFLEDCDNCKYCYAQGNFGEQKKAFELAVKVLTEHY